MFLEFFKFSTNQRLTLLIMCSLGFAKGFFPLRFPRKSPRPPCFWRPFGAGFVAEYARLFAPKGDRSFLVAGGARVSLNLPPWGMEFFGCRRGEGVSLPTAAGAGSRKTPTPQAGWAVVGDCGRIIGAKRILYERNVGGLNNLVLAQEEQ